MSDVATFSSENIRTWFESETHSLFIPVHSKAQKTLNEMNKTLGNLLDASKMLLENSAKETEKRNMKTYGRSRALNKLARLFVDRLQQMKTLDEVTYDTYQEFIIETQKALAVTEIDVRNWFPRISPYFILDRRKFLTVFEKAKTQLKESGNFLSKEYVKTKTLEETFALIDELQTLDKQLTNLKEQKSKTENEKSLVAKEISDIQKKFTDLKSSGSMNQLTMTGIEIYKARAEVKQRMQHLQKPFLKLQSLASHGEGSGLTPDELGKLTEYLNDPFSALASETTGYPLLRQILSKLDHMLPEQKLKLKPEKTRKAQQLIDDIIRRNSLEELHEQSVNLTLQKRRLSDSPEVAEAQNKMLKLEKRLDEFQTKMKVVEGEETTLAKTQGEIEARIRNCKNKIEEKVLSFVGKKIRIE